MGPQSPFRPQLGTDADRAYYLGNILTCALCYFLGGALIQNFRFARRSDLDLLDEATRKIWDWTLLAVCMGVGHAFRSAYDAGEQAYLVSVEFPCWAGWSYQYRTSRQAISINDVSDAMYEVTDINPRAVRSVRENGQQYFTFSWMFLDSDVSRLLGMFRRAGQYRPDWDLSISRAVFSDMDYMLNALARKAVNVYPFIACEFSGW